MEIEISRGGFGKKLNMLTLIFLSITSPGLLCAQHGARWGDVVFNEIMYDPTPVVKVDSGEYVELYNTSGKDLYLEGWILQSGPRNHTLGPIYLRSGDFLVLSGISLPNSGAQLALYSGEGVLIHATEYNEPWYGEGWKKEGGWSLENPDPHIPCIAYQFWEYSTDPSGGTPGRENSVLRRIGDVDPPVLLWYGLPEPGTVSLHYSEPVRMPSSLWKRITTLGGEDAADSIWFGDLLSRTLYCHIRSGIAERRSYRLLVPGMNDCMGNEGTEEELEVSIPVDPDPRSLLINEIMYDPEEGAPEYIELYQPGPGIVELRDFSVAIAGEEGPGKLLRLSSCSRMLTPGTYLLITRIPGAMISFYGLDDERHIVELEELGSLPDSGAEIWLCDLSGSIVDRVYYSDEMHMDLLGITSGISLERISPAVSSGDPASWHSAASMAGYATPGQQNSQYLSDDSGGEELTLEPRVFSPDQDGYEDVLRILPGKVEHGTLLNLWISDPAGRLIRILANNHLVAPSSRYTWDGEDEGGNMVQEGIFVVHAGYFHPSSGKQWSSKIAGAIVY